MNFRIPFTVLLPLLIALAAPAHAAPRETPRILECTGPFARNATHASLVKAFGPGNVTVQKVGIGEGETVTASVIFPRDKARRVEVLWIDEKRRRKPSEIRVSTGSRWRTAQGVAVGMPLAEVESINGKPFLMYGFGWDYGGTANEWQEGALAAKSGECVLWLRFDQTQRTDADIDGERSFSSDDAGMRSAKPVVDEIMLRFEHAE
jgi:hypothetical protein